MRDSTKILGVVVIAMLILFNMPLIISFFMMIFFFLIKITWNLLWVVAIVGVVSIYLLGRKG